MKPLTHRQKDIIIQKIQNSYNDAVRAKTVEQAKKIKLESIQLSYAKQINQIVDLYSEINNLQKSLTDLKTELNHSFVKYSWYNSRDVFRDEDKDIKDKLKYRIAKNIVESNIKFPDYNAIEDELELYSLSKDFDLQGILDKYSYKEQ